MYQSYRSFNIPPGNPRAFEFLKKFVQIPPSPRRKADYCFNFSVASIMLLKLCMSTSFIRQHIFTYYKYYKSVLNTLKYGAQLV